MALCSWETACACAKRLLLAAAVYLLGCWGLSVAWLVAPVALATLRDAGRDQRAIRRGVAAAATLGAERDALLERVDPRDLPPWVYFPDVERMEWFNKILRQLWPNANHYARALLRDSIEPGVRASLAQYRLHAFRFEKIVLGNNPMRIRGVQVYDLDVERNEIIVDLNLYYAGDCDISFSIGGLKGGLKDFQLHGLVRAVLKPLLGEMPLVGGLQVFFLNSPAVDFDLVGVADMLDMPGISDLLRRTIVEVISGIMVLPNKLPIPLSPAVAAEELRMPRLEGVLRVHVVEARDLMAKDLGFLPLLSRKPTSDPYAVLTLGAEEFRTDIVSATVNPKWDFWCEADVGSPKSQEVKLELWDWDPGFPGVQNDDFLGRATVEVSTIVAKGEADLWLRLDMADRGSVHVRFKWFQLSSDAAALPLALAETRLLGRPELSAAVLTVYVASAENLPGGMTSSKINPLVRLQLGGGRRAQQTAWHSDTRDPSFEQAFTLLAPNPLTDVLDVRVLNQATGSELGRAAVQLAALLAEEGLSAPRRAYPLAPTGGGGACVHMALKLWILEAARPAVEEEEEEDAAAAAAAAESTEDECGCPADGGEGGGGEGGGEQGAERAGSVRSVKQKVAAPTPTPNATSIEEECRREEAPPAASPPQAAAGGAGRVQLTLRYSVYSQKLLVVVHRVTNLPFKDDDSIPDPYIKLYLLPHRHKDSKRKTETVKESRNPVFDETFEYVMSQSEMNCSRLEVTVAARSRWLAAPALLGQAVVDLSKVGLPRATTRWFDLQPQLNEADS